MSNINKTLAMRLLEGKNVAYEAFAYPDHIKDAEDVAAEVSASPEAVFKTLVVRPPRPRDKPMLVMVPSNTQLNLKKLAKAVGAKKVKLASHQEAEAMTGLQVGGISALALLHKSFAIYLDKRAQALDHLYVSAGQRGIQIRLAVQDLVDVTGARYVDAAS